MTKFNVGDEIKVTQNTSCIGDKNTAGWHVSGQGIVKIGAIGMIESVVGNLIEARFKEEDVEDGARGFSRKLRFDEIESVESKPTKNQRITALENEVAELKLIVHELRDGRKTMRDVMNKVLNEPSTPTVEDDKPLTPNQQRFLTIIDAKRFIAERQAVMLFGHVDFIVNTEKRTIVALLKPLGSNQVVKRGIAKCDPNDVFNEHIGKAIALGRALGLDVSEFEQAVQPTVALGQKIFTLGYFEEFKFVDNEKWVLEVNGINEVGHPTHDNGTFTTHYKIINDTNAIYEVES